MDVWGPDDTPSIRGNIYKVGFIDSKSGKLWLYYTTTKQVYDVTADFLSSVIPYCRQKHGLKDFVVQSDWGEFKSDAVQKLLQQYDGKRKICCAYSPETQSRIERTWRTNVELASAMLLAKKLPEPFWEDASRYACIIYNFLPPSRQGGEEQRLSPHQIYTLENPNLEHLHPFG